MDVLPRTANQAVLEGHFQVSELRPGMILRCADTRDLCSNTTRAELKPALKLVVLLGGSTDVSFGRRRLAWQGASPARAGEAAVVALAEPEQFIRRATAGNAERSLTLTLTQEWFESGALAQDGAWPRLQSFIRTHLAAACWRPSRRMMALAEEVSRPAMFVPGLLALHQESRCIALASEALATVLGGMQEQEQERMPAVPVNARIAARLRQLRELLDCGEGDALGLSALARAVGINVNAMQRGFRELTGVSVAEYARRVRLERARRALLQDGASIALAATLAGYSSTANFSTAFRRHFGVTPGQARDTL
ncbi:Regulatory protein PchR [Pigmentiphaga humi]|uniref:Regulatory protein PchR n=2 Tax=Pigmentiphaga humi TaxID=2478468 RepID=A0A3P4BBG2_9BURK|nr:Regulatory protein PchR [Pigmentiphaga humi]